MAEMMRSLPAAMAETYVPIAEDELTLTTLKTDLERSGGCRQWINDNAIERLSSKITELFQRHNIRLAQVLEDVTDRKSVV